jgi:transcriptional regulator of acetoin/glycerol metabolism
MARHVRVRHLPAAATGSVEAAREALFGDAGATLASHMREVERERLMRALAMFGGNRTHAAEALDISREGLHKKLKTHGIAPLRRAP